MAYYAPFYRPTYYDQMNTPGFNQQPIVQQVQQMPTPAPQTNNGLVWVQGEVAAKSYPVAPNCTVMLMDSEGERFYLKSADASGMPLPLRVFEYTERNNAPTGDFKGCTSDFSEMDDRFVTREEFERRMASIGSGCKCKEHNKNKLTEEATDGE